MAANLIVLITKVDITAPVMLDTDSGMTTTAAKVNSRGYLQTRADPEEY